MGLQLVLEAELLAATIALVGLLASVDALVALQRALVPEAAAAELALIGVVACKHRGGSEPQPAPQHGDTPGTHCHHSGGGPATPPRHPAPCSLMLGSAAGSGEQGPL